MVRCINFCCHSSPVLCTTDGSWRWPSWPWLFPCCLVPICAHFIHVHWLLWLQQVTIAETYVVEDGAAGDDLGDIEDVHLQSLQEDCPPPCLHHPEAPFDDHPGLRQPAIECCLHLVTEGMAVRGHEGDGLGQAGVATIPDDAVPGWGVSPLIIQRAVP